MTNPKVTFKNSLAISIDVYDHYTAKGASSMAITKLGSIPAGGTLSIDTLHAVSYLAITHSGSVSGITTDYYQQFPIASFNITPFDSNYTHTITSDHQLGMEQAFKFIKYITANPLSNTATKFQSIIKNNKSNNFESAVNNYFLGLNNFSKCNVTSWAAMNLWLFNGFSAWQEDTYYLYSVPGSSTAPISEIATASIKVTNSGTTASVTKDNSKVNLAIKKGNIQEASVGNSALSISLSPTWTYVDSTISPSLSGTINSTKVLGTKSKRDLASHSHSSSSSSNNGFSAATITGLSMNAGFILFMVAEKYISYRSKKSAARTAEETKAVNEEFNKNLESITTELKGIKKEVTDIKESINSEETAQESMIKQEMKLDGGANADIEAQAETLMGFENNEILNFQNVQDRLDTSRLKIEESLNEDVMKESQDIQNDIKRSEKIANEEDATLEEINEQENEEETNIENENAEVDVEPMDG
ncbi:hypothetical protein [Spartinivicinus poritis]|uniref:Uncharacterized protein n=1 Tax=Spartinivicinus poritis TaxID=2994640 RepID=A0ABT5UC50_9GAMM|nr:hypothetical protein [Spartinivicinus sp. A2-2]MDE1463003.1 hypothetical protein [Spartinivicinus sp. A2-2]